MGNYHNDQPIQGTSDDPDLLNRSRFAGHLANILCLDKNDECLTVSLESEWGYGKTSVINLIKSKLKEENEKILVVEYNPWLVGNPESLIQDFLLQFSSLLNIRDNSRDGLQASKELFAYANLFSVAKLIPRLSTEATLVELVFNGVASITKKISKLKELDILGRKRKVINALQKVKKSIIVIIDDIDRLTPTETFQVLRLVKAVADFPGTSFLLAFDPKYVSASLRENSIENASEYIEKIVQVRVSLPVISVRDLDKLAEREFAKIINRNMIGRFEKDEERWEWICQRCFKYLIKNPRELKKFFNRLRFILEQVEGQVCFGDLVGLTLIATKSNDIYEHIKSRPEAYIGRRFDSYGWLMGKPVEIVEKNKESREEVLSKFNLVDGQELLREILDELFPLTKSSPSKSSLFPVSDDDAAGRVSAPQRLHIALHYTTPIGYIADDQILDFINSKSTDDRMLFLERTLSDAASDRFFEMMGNYAAKCKDNALEILCSIYDAYLEPSQLEELSQDGRSFLSNGLYRKMNDLTINIISSLESESRYKTIFEIINRQENTPLSAELMSRAREQVRVSSEGGFYGEPWLQPEQLKAVKECFRDVAISVLKNKNFLGMHLEHIIFHELHRIFPSETKEFMSEILNSPAGIVRVAEIIGRGDRSLSKDFCSSFSGDTYRDIFDLDQLREEASKALETNELSIKVRAILKSMVDGKRYYLRDGSLASDD